MGIDIVESASSINAGRNLGLARTRQNAALERLSSGWRINRAGDDAAGLAVSEKLGAGLRSMEQALRNAGSGISLVQTAEGALGESASILGRMRELAMQSANGTLSSTDRAAIGNEFGQLGQELDRIAGSTEFNGTRLLDGSISSTDTAVALQVGTGNDPAQDRISIRIASATSSALGVGASQVSVGSQEGARDALASVDAAIAKIGSQRGELGAAQNRLSSTINNLKLSHENANAAWSRVRDTDFAVEAANFVKERIIARAGVAVLAQANQRTMTALELLK